MGKRKATPATDGAGPGLADGPTHRSGAVARMLDMPVATLRVWERRYDLTPRAPSPGGQRRYSAEDVRRLALMKRLVHLGHAIGSLASLDMAQLQRVATTHAQVRADAGGEGDGLTVASSARPARAVPPWRLAVIGVGLGRRLQRPALLRRIGRPLELLGPFDDLAQAAAALRGAEVDALLVHEPQLHDGWLSSLGEAAPDLAKLPKAVLYGFAADASCDALATAGTALLREPQPDAVLAQWLGGLAKVAPRPLHGGARSASDAESVAPRRWDDAVLVEFAGRSSTIACECPRHVAELLVQVAHFESYSAACEHRNAPDAELHAYLRRVAAATRSHLETALEHVALHEGLLLPPSRPPSPGQGDGVAAPGSRHGKPAAGRRRS